MWIFCTNNNVSWSSYLVYGGIKVKVFNKVFNLSEQIIIKIWKGIVIAQSWAQACVFFRVWTTYSEVSLYNTEASVFSFLVSAMNTIVVIVLVSINNIPIHVNAHMLNTRRSVGFLVLDSPPPHNYCPR